MRSSFPVAAPEAVGLDPARLHAAHRRIARDLPHVTSLLVARRGHLAFERYYGIEAGEPQDTQSVAKSLVSLLTGIALARGFLEGPEQPVLPLLGEAAAQDPRWSRVTLRHLLTMTSGLPSELTDSAYDDAWMASPDPVRFALAQPLVCEPGMTFHYSNAGVHVLGAALAGAVGRDLAQFAQEALLTPLGIPVPEWPRDPRGRPLASGGLRLTPRALLLLGQLVLQRGRWEGQPLVPRSWVEEATRPHVRGYEWMEGIPDYGLLWWVTREGGAEAWYATGYGGQYLAVFPDLDLVAVMTGKVENHPSHRHIIAREVRGAAR
ncbi:beta-lactamase [Deinococcus aerius]|uniref:Beta-lactamase n=1 Tax=Deinococcus aerius TaxID=200253 RepID=A0A2I9DAR8_9DEIO|nr:serine hydrolase domain-containing protein [Deinococcus aerius]GBF08036.1 beta-lactamase [Deinococcus aerius]